MQIELWDTSVLLSLCRILYFCLNSHLSFLVFNIYFYDNDNYYDVLFIFYDNEILWYLLIFIKKPKPI